METVTERRPYNSRWSRDATFRNGKLKALRLTERDFQALRLFTRYRYLPADYVHAFVGGSKKVVLDRLGRMTREPYRYLVRPAWLRSKIDPIYRPSVYELDKPGELLIGASRPNAHENADHELMACCAMASFDLAARDTQGVRFISWEEILASDGMPPKSRDLAQPYTLQVTVTVNGVTNMQHVCADTPPFGIERTLDGKKTYFFFSGIEADCNTEPVFTSNYKRSSIYRKVIEYRAIVEQNIHCSQWGVPNLYVPILTTTPAHASSILKLIHHLTDGKGSKHLLVGVFPGFTPLGKPPAAYLDMLDFQFQRVGYRAFNILKS
ncbi:MAG: hypothetical protein ACLQME_07925 [Alphaproteobacteria bacterium]